MINVKDLRFDGQRYPVVEMFTSLQFEGFRHGTLNHYLRLAGCNRSCDFCDTDPNPKEWMTPGQIVERFLEMDKKVVTGNFIITGGEPFVHDLRPLLARLYPSFIAVETNGDFMGDNEIVDESLGFIEWLTVSPKGDVSETAKFEADELKYIIPSCEKWVDFDHQNVFVQPEWGNKRALKQCLKIMTEHPNVRLSIQTHKYLGLK
jgi:organic radical activating enzyme